MSNDEEVIAEIDRAFGACPKPEHFTNYEHCEECAEHDQLLRERTRETLTTEDVGNMGWQPIAFCSAEGIAYYFPALARLACAQPTYAFGWYADDLLIHLTHDGCNNRFRKVCDAQQRRAVSQLLQRLQERLGQEWCLSTEQHFVDARALWDKP